jgi:hypothetical protein
MSKLSVTCADWRPLTATHCAASHAERAIAAYPKAFAETVS